MKKALFFLTIALCFNTIISGNMVEKLKALPQKFEALEKLLPKYVEVNWEIEKKNRIKYDRQKVNAITKRLKNSIYQQAIFLTATHNDQQYRAVIELEKEKKTIDLQSIRIKIISFSKHYNSEFIDPLEEEFAEEGSLEKYTTAILSLKNDEKEVIVDFTKLVTEINDILIELPNHIAKGYADAKREQLEKLCDTSKENKETPSYFS